MYDEFDKPELNKTEERYRKKIQSEIVSCYNCQPYDEGEPVWIFGDKTEIEELFYKFNVDEKYWDNILEHLVCNCGTEITLGGDVGVRTKYEVTLEKFINKSNKSFVKKINSYINFLRTTPLLGYKHPLGKNIYKELKNTKFPIITLSKNDCFYRARKVNGSDILESSEMLHAPLGKSMEGRFNHSGQSHLYLANSKETAIKEVIYNLKNSLVWVQDLKISNDVENILDLTFDITNISLNDNTLLLSLSLTNALEENKNNLGNWKPDYFLTRFIMDCAKELKYNGIKYNSTRSLNDYNLVLFYPEEFKVENVGNPTVEVFRKVNREVFDY